MRLPNAERAVVDAVKLRDYVLNQVHQRGRHKARVFLSALGLTAADAEELRAALLDAAKTGAPRVGRLDEFGARYVIDFEMARGGRRAPGFAVRGSRALR